MTIEIRNVVPQSDQRPVAWIRQAAPYIHAFRGRSFVIAFGGEVLSEGVAEALIHDIALLDAIGIRLVLVCGARPQIDAEMQRRGLAETDPSLDVDYESRMPKRWSASNELWAFRISRFRPCSRRACPTHRSLALFCA